MFTKCIMLVPLFFYATSTNLSPNNSIVSESLWNMFKLSRQSITSFILFHPLIQQHKLLSWNPLYFCSKLEIFVGTGFSILQLQKMSLNIMHLIISICIYCVLLYGCWTSWIIPLIFPYLSFAIYVFDVVHLGQFLPTYLLTLVQSF